MTGPSQERLHAWASTFPWNCPDYCAKSHNHTTMVGDPCAVCGQPLLPDQECYYVTEPPDGRKRSDDQAVCWRHVRNAPTTIKL